MTRTQNSDRLSCSGRSPMWSVRGEQPLVLCSRRTAVRPGRCEGTGRAGQEAGRPGGRWGGRGPGGGRLQTGQAPRCRGEGRRSGGHRACLSSGLAASSETGRVTLYLVPVLGAGTEDGGRRLGRRGPEAETRSRGSQAGLAVLTRPGLWSGPLLPRKRPVGRGPGRAPSSRRRLLSESGHVWAGGTPELDQGAARPSRAPREPSLTCELNLLALPGRAYQDCLDSAVPVAAQAFSACPRECPGCRRPVLFASRPPPPIPGPAEPHRPACAPRPGPRLCTCCRLAGTLPPPPCTPLLLSSHRPSGLPSAGVDQRPLPVRSPASRVPPACVRVRVCSRRAGLCPPAWPLRSGAELGADPGPAGQGAVTPRV